MDKPHSDGPIRFCTASLTRPLQPEASYWYEGQCLAKLKGTTRQWNPESAGKCFLSDVGKTDKKKKKSNLGDPAAVRGYRRARRHQHPSNVRPFFTKWIIMMLTTGKCSLRLKQSKLCFSIQTESPLVEKTSFKCRHSEGKLTRKGDR